jgi:hypothetical protein
MGPADPIDQLLRPSALVVPVLGAGVAQSAGLPGASDLAELLLLKSGADAAYPGDRGVLFAVFDFVVPTYVSEREALEMIAVHIRAWPHGNSPLIEALLGIPSRLLVTLNYDLSIEHTAEALGYPVVSLGASRRDLEEAHRLLVSDEPPEQLTVIHLHGSVAEPHEMVLGAEGYRRIAEGPATRVIYELAVRRTLVFYGTTLDENYALAELQKIPNRREHVLWCRKDEAEALTSGRQPILFGRTSIHLRTVSSYDELPVTVMRLLTEPAVRAAPTSLSSSTTMGAAGFEPAASRV